MNANLSDITMNNPDVFFVEYNLFNNYYLALRNCSDVYVSSLYYQSNNQLDLFQIILIVSATALSLAYFIL